MTGWIIHEASDVPDSSVVWLSQQHHNQGGTLALAHNKLFTCQLDGNDNNTALEGPPRSRRFRPCLRDANTLADHAHIQLLSQLALGHPEMILVCLEINYPIFRPMSLDLSVYIGLSLQSQSQMFDDV